MRVHVTAGFRGLLPVEFVATVKKNTSRPSTVASQVFRNTAQSVVKTKLNIIELKSLVT